MSLGRALNIALRGDESEFEPDVCQFWQQGRIPRSPLPAQTRYMQWLHNDSEENYELRGNKDFSRDSVSYCFNSLGYRSAEFRPDSGKRAAVFLGCSTTLGVGIPFDALWTTLVTRHLEQLWQSPVLQYNLAWSGTGSDYVAMMIHQCIEILKPDAVFVLWSFVNRMTWFADTSRPFYFLPSHTRSTRPDEHQAYLRLATNAQSFFNYVRNFHLVRDRLLRLNIPYYWGNLEYFSDTMLAHYVPLDQFVGRWKRVDVARDNQHSGVKTHAGFAKLITARLEADRDVSCNDEHGGTRS